MTDRQTQGERERERGKERERERERKKERDNEREIKGKKLKYQDVHIRCIYAKHKLRLVTVYNLLCTLYNIITAQGKININTAIKIFLNIFS